MFEHLKPAPQDKIFALMAAFNEDERQGKIDLGIGVYKDDHGKTPIMSAVKKAEQRLLETASTKGYVGVGGDKAFNAAMIDLALADSVPAERVRAVQAPGGTGALWVLMMLIKRSNPDARVWISDPSWPNHTPMVEQVGLEPAVYPYFDRSTGLVNFEAMIETLDGLGKNDVVLLHGCCHNPTGANLSLEQWGRVADSLERTGAFPLIDMAYQGFGDGLDKDAAGVRLLASRLPEFVMATSCSKNFGLYRDRAGCAIAVGESARTADLALKQMLSAVRAAYSQPPAHGAEVVATILGDSALRAEWEAELEAMRNRMIANRTALAEAIRERSNSTDFDFVAEHRGMFSLLGVSEKVVERLKDEDAIYMLDDSRINIAGLAEDRVVKLADALVAATR
ncbi:aromatic amino acid transaminase [Pelagibacterium montanilacus]|uniref:amino acid aminotransferase n=1 Tax=Pelagibacterium montanilacus TaxID=2185280 RepID=UPI000F8D1E2C|nr:amino acid aminotransferase [Pelagibacterium montanilacus]